MLREGFLDLFGKPVRESACECERGTSMMLGPILTLVNGPVVADALRDPNNRIARLLATEKDDAKLIEELYLAVLCRLPTPSEVKAGCQALKDGESDFLAMKEEGTRRQAAVKAYEQQLNVRQAQWEATQNNPPIWTPTEIVSATAKAKDVKLNIQSGGIVLASGPVPNTDTYTVTAKTKLKGITGFRLEVLPDPSLGGQGPGRAPNGNFVLNQLKLAYKEEGAKGDPKPLGLGQSGATFAQAGFPAADALSNDPVKGWAIAHEFGKPNSAYYEFQTPLTTGKDTELIVTLGMNSQHLQHTIGKFRIYLTTTKPPLMVKPLPENLTKIFAVDAAKRTAGAEGGN